MAEIEVGEYVRTEEGYILENIMMAHKDIIEKLEIKDEYYLSSYGKITKHSKNLIDLIEVGDFVNGYKIVKITKDIISDRKKMLSENFKYDNFGNGILIQFYNEEIETILTHEQFERNCFCTEGS